MTLMIVEAQFKDAREAEGETAESQAINKTVIGAVGDRPPDG